MAIQICSQCATKVLPTQEGSCPACQRAFGHPVETASDINILNPVRPSLPSLLVLLGLVATVVLMGRANKGTRQDLLKLLHKLKPQHRQVA